jgi:membrane protein DedA with SNARE-associated domain
MPDNRNVRMQLTDPPSAISRRHPTELPAMAQLMSLLVQNAILVVFIASFAARLGLPVPAAAVLVVTGALLAAGDVSVIGVVLAAVIANLLGDGAWFYAGRRFGYRFMRLLCRISLSPDSCVRRGESLISDWGGMSLVAAKFVPGVSVVAPPMAGALGMSVRRFISFDIGAALVWTGLFLGLGWLFRNQIQDVLAVHGPGRRHCHRGARGAAARDPGGALLAPPRLHAAHRHAAHHGRRAARSC